MFKLYTCFLGLCIISVSALSQTESFKKDFNKDGVVDSVNITEDGGSSFSTKMVQFSDGKSKKISEFMITYSKGSFVSITVVPNALGNAGRESLGEVLFGKKGTMDPSLQWLIDAYSNELGSDEIPETIRQATNYTPIWIKGEPAIPDGYYTILSKKQYPKLQRVVDNWSDNDFKSDYYWVDYSTYGHEMGGRRGNQVVQKQGPFVVTLIDSTFSLFNTSHGVILKRNGSYSWVFISDQLINENANEKFRWPSIMDVKMIGEYILVLHSAGTFQSLYIVNLNTGYVLLINNDGNSIESLKVDSSQVELVGQAESSILTLDQINQIFKRVSGN